MAASRSPVSPRTGFTLVELMIIVTILGILAVVALSNYTDLVRRSKEGSTKANLGAIRSALMIYYGENEGHFPQGLAPLAVGGQYMSSIPTARTPNYHADSSGMNLNGTTSPVVAPPECAGLLFSPAFDGGGWLYYNPRAVPTGCVLTPDTILVNCTHTDSKGNSWSSF